MMKLQQLSIAALVAFFIAASATYADAACYWWMFCDCIPEWWCW